MRGPGVYKFIVYSTLLLLSLAGCDNGQGPDEDEVPDISAFPGFFTPNEDYYITRLNDVPVINADEYRLQLSGALDEPGSLTLSELYELESESLPLTVECIGNPENAPLLSTAEWEGFNLHDLLMARGLRSTAVSVQYHCADGYYASHTIEQLEDLQVLGALFMNGDTLPDVQGFPLRVLVPGYYGVKQPAWVTRIEVLETEGDDFWNHYNWDTSPPMPPDCKINFPSNYSKFTLGDTVVVGGTAYGGGRIGLVEVTVDGGTFWRDAEIIHSIDADHVWVFWQIELILTEAKQYALYARAWDLDGNTQPGQDLNTRDGNNAWPLVRFTLEP